MKLKWGILSFSLFYLFVAVLLKGFYPLPSTFAQVHLYYLVASLLIFVLFSFSFLKLVGWEILINSISINSRVRALIFKGYDHKEIFNSILSDAKRLGLTGKDIAFYLSRHSTKSRIIIYRKLTLFTKNLNLLVYLLSIGSLAYLGGDFVSWLFSFLLVFALALFLPNYLYELSSWFINCVSHCFVAIVCQSILIFNKESSPITYPIMFFCFLLGCLNFWTAHNLFGRPMLRKGWDDGRGEPIFYDTPDQKR